MLYVIRQNDGYLVKICCMSNGCQETTEDYSNRKWICKVLHEPYGVCNINFISSVAIFALFAVGAPQCERWNISMIVIITTIVRTDRNERNNHFNRNKKKMHSVNANLCYFAYFLSMCYFFSRCYPTIFLSVFSKNLLDWIMDIQQCQIYFGYSVFRKISLGRYLRFCLTYTDIH